MLCWLLTLLLICIEVLNLIDCQEADQSAPQRHGPYFYYGRTIEGGQYRINCRRPLPAGLGGPSGAMVCHISVKQQCLRPPSHFLVSSLKAATWSSR